VMPEQFSPKSNPEIATGAERAAVQADTQAACADLRHQCEAALNESPAGRLQLVAAQAGLDLPAEKQAELLDQPQIALYFKRPLPMKEAFLQKCLKVLRDQLTLTSAKVEIAVPSSKAEDSAELQAVATSIETRVAVKEGELESTQISVEAKRERNAQTEAERDEALRKAAAAEASVDKFLRTGVDAGNLAHYRQATEQYSEDQYGEGTAEYKAFNNFAEKKFAQYETKLNAMQAVFTREEIQAVFGGSLANTVTLNLRSNNQAEIYADVFARINAGIADEDRRREVRAQVEAQLGIKSFPAKAKTGGDVNDIYKRGYGVESYIDENGEVQERKIEIGPGFEAEYKDGHRLGVDAQGDRYISILTTVGRRFKVKLPENALDREMGDIIRTVETRALLHTMNMVKPFYPSVTINEYDGGEMDVQPSDYSSTERFLEATLGNRAWAGNALLSTGDANQILYLLQFQNEKSDAVQGDVNPDQIRADFTRQGAMNKDGTIDWERFTSMIEANRNGLFFSEERFGENAQRAE